MQKEKKKRILVSPLNWGLGHATRCIPLIRHLLKSGHEVIIASDNEALALLKQAFPHLESTSLPAYDIHYPPGGNMLRHFITRSPKILSRIHDEHRALQEIIASQRIDAVISDNRFGLWSRRVPTAFITHQLFIRSPLLQGMIRKINQRYIHKFDHCWIPDLASGDTLSGELSRGGKCPKNVRYIGPLSRFNPGLRESDRDTESYEVAAIVSGPEPQRAFFERLLMKQLVRSGLKSILLTGCPKENTHCSIKNLDIHSHLPDAELEGILKRSGHIICRAGYSSIMDLAAIGRSAILIPTPGQTEQLYLASYHKKQKTFYSELQDGFDLQRALEKSGEYKGLKISPQHKLLKEAVEEFLQSN